MSVRTLTIILFLCNSCNHGMTFNSVDLHNIIKETGSNSEKSQVLYISDVDLDLDFADISVPFQTVCNMSLAKELVSQLLDYGTIIFVDTDNVSNLHSLLRVSILKNFFLSTWFIIGSSNYSEIDAFSLAYKNSTNQKLLSLDSQIFYVKRCHNVLVTCKDTIMQVLGNAHEDPSFKVCGTIGQSCNLKKAIEFVRDRLDFQGQNILVSYEHWPPFCKVNWTDHSVTGVIPDTVESIASHLNLTITYLPFRSKNLWARKLSNGTWIGDFADVSYGLRTTSVAGYIFTLERTEIGQFTSNLAFSKRGVSLKRPSADDFTVKNFTGEFKSRSWLVVFSAYVVMWLFLILFIHFNSGNGGLAKSMKDGLAVALRMFVYKGTPWLNFKTLSMKVVFVILFLMAMFLYFCYRASMNSFLAVKTFSLPINSFEEILDTDLGVVVWKDSAGEAFYKLAPEGSVRRQIYKEKILNSPGVLELGGLEAAALAVDSGKYLYAGDLETVISTPYYPCKITDIKPMRRNTGISLPFANDSPFFQPFQRVIEKLMENGELQRFIRRHPVGVGSEEDCESRKTSLGYNQLTVPFVCLGIGAALALVLVCGETIMFRPVRLTTDQMIISKKAKKIKEFEDRFAVAKSQLSIAELDALNSYFVNTLYVEK